VVADPSCVYAGRDSTALTLSFGTLVQVLDHEDPVASVALGDGQRGVLPRAALRDLPLGDATAHGDAVLGAARQFLGLPYLWGGTSAWGLDCSGLVHLVLRSFGVLLPRNADDQASSRRLTPVPLDEVQPGDLYFFATDGGPVSHVGFATAATHGAGGHRMLHAPEGGAGVEEGPLSPHRQRTLVAARRPVLRR
jgi:cell wall-associated NlpC family hydrolase